MELRDGDKSRYLGKGTLKAVGHINGEIAAGAARQGRHPAGRDRPRHDRARRHRQQGHAWAPTPSWRFPWPPRARPPRSQRTPLYRYLGGAGASILPVPMMNIINGGAHADNSVDVQEFMIAPFGAPKFSEALRMGAEVFHTLKKVLHKKGYSTAVGDEGGFAPNLKSNEEAIESRAGGHRAGRLQARRAGRRVPRSGRQRVLRGRQVRLQEIRQEPAHVPSRWWSIWANWVRQYPAIVSIEDGMAEEDWAGLEAADRHARQEDPARGRRYLRHQPGHLQARHRAGHRQFDPDQGEPDRHPDRDPGSHADGHRRRLHRGGLAPLRRNRGSVHRRLVVATGAGQIKTGSASRTDRICKYNQLLRIEEELGAAAQFLGRKAIRP